MKLSLWDLKQINPEINDFAEKLIMKLSLWDLKRTRLFVTATKIPYYEAIPMGFETMITTDERSTR